MAVKTLVVEIDQVTTRVVEMDYASKTPVIHNFFTFPTPLETTRDGAVKVNEDFVMMFKNLYSFNNMTAKQVLFLLSSSRITSRDVEIPYVADKQIQGVLEGSFTEYFPVDAEQYHFVYKILNRKTTDTGKSIELNMLCIPNDLTAGYFELSHALELQLVNICYVGNSSLLLQKIMAGEFVYISPLRKSLGPIVDKLNIQKKKVKDAINMEGPQVQDDGALILGVDEFANQTPISAVIKLEAYSSFVTIINNGEVVMQRPLTSGYSELLDMICSSTEFGEDLTQTDAMKILRDNTLINSTFREYQEGMSRLNESKIELTNSLRILIGSISRVLDFYTSRNSNTYIKDVILAGAGSNIKGLSHLLQNELGFEVETVEEFPKLIFAKQKNKPAAPKQDVPKSPAETVQQKEGFSLDDLSSMLAAKQQEEEEKLILPTSKKTEETDGGEPAKAQLPDEPEKEEFNPSLFSLLIASGMSEDGIITEAERYGDAEAAKARKEKKITIICFAGAAVIALVAAALFVYPMIMHGQAIEEQDKVKKSIAEYEAKNVEGEFYKYVSEQNKTAALKDILAATHSPNEHLVAFIEELEEKIPVDTIVESFIATEQGITLNFISTNKVSAAKTLMQLKTFASAEMVSSASLTDTDTYIERHADDRQVSFAVSFVYKNVPYDVDQYLEEEMSKEAGNENN